MSPHPLACRVLCLRCPACQWDDVAGSVMRPVCLAGDGGRRDGKQKRSEYCPPSPARLGSERTLSAGTAVHAEFAFTPVFCLCTRSIQVPSWPILHARSSSCAGSSHRQNPSHTHSLSSHACPWVGRGH